MRQLASIQQITALDPIEGADAIECASVLGWKVVVKKGEFSVGDLAVYMEIDSVPPDDPEYRFLWKNADMRPNNFRIKTIKLRGQISQGILFPLSALPERERNNETHGFLIEPSGERVPIVRRTLRAEYWGEGSDVTDLLGVTKYEPPLPSGSNDVEGQFFDGVTKTDEERVQSAEGAKRLARLRGRRFYITEKQDGASMTIAMHDNTAKVASRNYRLANLPDSAYWNAARREYGPLSEPMYDFVIDRPWLAMQGELVGPGIQNNRLGLKEHECRIFNIYDRDKGVFWSLSEMLDASEQWGFPLVPIVEVGHLFNYDQEDLLRLAEGKYAGTSNEREGIVIRSNDGLDRVSLKVISNRYLLKGGD